MPETTPNVMRPHWHGLARRGALSVAFGLVAMLWPDITVDVLVVLFGTCALAEGAVSLVAAAKSNTPDRGWLAAAGVGAIVVGVITFVWPSITAGVLACLIGAWFIVTGAEHVVATTRMPRRTPGRGLLGVAGVVSALFGTYLVAFPGRGAVAFITAIGLFAVVRGVTLLIVAVASRRQLSFDAGAATAQVAAR